MGVCKDCVWYNNLKHNLGTKHGYRSSHCCTIEFETNGGDVIQVLPNSSCGDFAEKNGTKFYDEHTRPDPNVDVVFCGDCVFMRTDVEDGERHYRCKLTEKIISPVASYCSDGRKYDS